MGGKRVTANVETFEVSSTITLVADRFGPDGGAPVLLFHGGGQTRWSWGATGKVLGDQGFLVRSFDLRGHGESSWCPGGQYGVDNFAADLRAVIRQMPAPPLVVGASLGGISALLACGEVPQATCAGLVLVDISPNMNRGGTSRVSEFMRSTAGGFDTLEDAAAAIAAYTPGRSKPVRPEGLTKNLHQGADGRWYWHWDPAFLAPKPGWSPDALEARMMAAAHSIEAPTLIVRGAKSDVLTSEAMDHLRSALPHVEQAEIPGAGHMIAGDDNANFNAAILPFIARHAHRRG